MSTETLSVPLELRFVDDGPGYLEGIAVPYGEVTYLAAGEPRGERFIAGAFTASLAARAASGIRLVDSHLEGFVRRPYGVLAEAEDRDDGLWTRWRFYDTPSGQEGRAEARAGTYGGLSVGFKAVRQRRAADGVREVLEAQLHHVALVDEPAYSGARLLAVREAATVERPAPWEPPEIHEFPDPWS